MNKRNTLYWRITNTVFLLISFFLPWHVVCSDVRLDFCFDVPGWRVVFISIEVLLEAPELLSYIEGTLIDVGEVCLILYTLLNCTLIVAYHHSVTKYLRRLSLITIVFSILMIRQIGEPMFNTGLTWGYWLTCIGLLSGLILEIVEPVLLN